MQALPLPGGYGYDSKPVDEFEPPSYDEIAREETPPYMENTVVTTSIGEDGDVLIEGLPVGDALTFFVNMLFSIAFDFVGYMLTTMLATNHAAMHGSRSGLGFTLIRYGFLLKAKTREAELIAYQYDPDNFDQEERVAQQNEWVAYTMIVIGFFVMLRANAEFVRAQRLKAVILATSDLSTA